MQFRIADTFTDSLAKLNNEEQKAVKTAAFDLQANPANPGFQLHRLDNTRDPNFWSVRAGRDIRIILHQTEESMLLCYVDHHDKAYAWAERRKIETHPRTGAAQIVEIRERVEEITIPVYRTEEYAKPLPFAGMVKEDLLQYGVPEEWADDILAADEDSLLRLAGFLPKEAAEAVLELATGGKPAVLEYGLPDVDPFDHPDAQRRFRILENAEELALALEYPWEKWTVFLHPVQRRVVEKQFGGPARISGSAGTGKTIVALHRAVYLARKNEDARILLTTFSDTLATALKSKLKILTSSSPRLMDQIEVQSLPGVGLRLYSAVFGRPAIADANLIREYLAHASGEVNNDRFSQSFLCHEWTEVVDAWQLETWEKYRDVQRLGRKTRLSEQQRQLLWRIFEKVQDWLRDSKKYTEPMLLSRLTDYYEVKSTSPYDYMIVDESQDVSIAQLKFLASIGKHEEESLFFTGDLGQRIFNTPFSWKSLGVDIRGRSHTLKINYRTSHQIRGQADRLLDQKLVDVDGIMESRSGTVSTFNGPEPIIIKPESVEEEIDKVAGWIKERFLDGVAPHEIGLFVRSNEQLPRAREVMKKLGVKYLELENQYESSEDHISISTMHLAKGLEFKSVVVMACDDDVMPLQGRIEEVVDDSDLEEVYSTERRLLYVACTRAREHLFVSGVAPASEYLDDLSG